MRTRILMTSTDYPRLQQCFAVKDASICCIISSQTAQFVYRNVYRKLKRARRGEKLEFQVTMYRTVTAQSVDTNFSHMTNAYIRWCKKSWSPSSTF